MTLNSNFENREKLVPAQKTDSKVRLKCRALLFTTKNRSFINNLSSFNDVAGRTNASSGSRVLDPCSKATVLPILINLFPKLLMMYPLN
jgi:hypothetical protein